MGKYSDKTAVIIGSFINGFSIWRSLQAINFPGEVYVINLDQAYSKKSLLKICAPQVIEINKIVDSAESIANILNNIPGECKCVFFTSEESIPYVREAIQNHLIQSEVTMFPGPEANLDILVNKYDFYRFIEKYDLAPVPQTVDGYEDPFAYFSHFIFRPKRSWENEIKTPRVKIVHNKEQFEDAKKEYEVLGLDNSCWCYQEILDVAPRSNVSVTGWYDSEFSQMYVNRKIKRHPEDTGICDVVEDMTEYPEALIWQTRNVLEKLNYSGPFELEFLLDQSSGKYKVIDLNPRYWMQHELIEKRMNYYMIRRNLGERGITPEPELEHYQYWINSNQLIWRLLKGQIGMIKYLRGAVLAPGILHSVKWIGYLLVGKMKAKVGGKGEKR